MKTPIQHLLFLLCSFIFSHSIVNAEQANYNHHAKELSDHIGKYWLLNKGDSIQGNCIIQLTLKQSGFIETINMDECIGNILIQKTALKSISQALPLPVPEGSVDFKKFRDMKIYFDSVHAEII